MSGLLVMGAGGHGKVVADTASCTDRWNKIAFLDDRYESLSRVMNWPVVGGFNKVPDFIEEFSDIIVAIGNSTLRVQLLKRFAELGFNIPSIVHPTAFVSKAAELEPGSVVFAHAVVNAGAHIGLGCIINTGATVDHDCILGEGAHICPGVHLAGEVLVGNYSWIGIGASVVNLVSIGENVLIGAGSVIVSHIQSNVIVTGVPGRVVKRNEAS